MWDRLFTHSIRPDGYDGLLIPYHDYLDPTGDVEEDLRRRELAKEIAVVPEPVHIMSFSYAGELSTPDVALSTLVKCLETVRRIRKHGIASGPWKQREEWLNEQIGGAWLDRGAFPGAGAALEALGMRLGTTMVLELIENEIIGQLQDPWPVLNSILRGETDPPQLAYKPDVEAVAQTWVNLSDERRALIQLLSRFNLSPIQARRWFDPIERAKSSRGHINDQDILDNPYSIVESDLGDADERPVTLGVIDRGLLPDDTIAVAHPVPAPSVIDSHIDARRVRAALVTVLRQAAEQGDSLLTEGEALETLTTLDLTHPCTVGVDWIKGNLEYLSSEIDHIELLVDPSTNNALPCLQLSDLCNREKRLASILRKRAAVSLPSLSEDWKQLLIEALSERNVEVDSSNSRHAEALQEQAEALNRVTTRKLSVLVGRAGTGKTTVLGALMKSNDLVKQGILFLAPTGKARVRLEQKTAATGMTVAQFLNRQGRYDGIRQRPLFDGEQVYAKERTVVIDECSMLTMDDLFAVLSTLDLGHVQRIVLVGDPNQLPPIGAGRPFADLVAYLDELAEEGNPEGDSLSRLTIELRTTAGSPSDTLRLASWFTREPQPVDADRVLSDLELGAKFNDLEVCYWQTPEELWSLLEQMFVRNLGLKNAKDVEGFNIALGLTREGWVPFDNHDGAENFQLLSPVRREYYGVYDINHWIQQHYRENQLRESRKAWGLSLGDEEIVWGDKAILLRNGYRKGWDGKNRINAEEYLANGEVGLAANPFGGAKGKFLNIAFAGHPDVRFGFFGRDFSEEGVPLELAYALTVHKAQGSEFGKVFVVLPKRTRLLTRELFYTALTRSKDRLVLLVEGTGPDFLFNLTHRSETARRNTNLFKPGIRLMAGVKTALATEGELYASHLVHRTTRGHLVRSKSELAIADYLYSVNLPYHYERPLQGTAIPGRLRPDFSFIDDAGNVIIWEHLGMLNRADYRKGWEWKQDWYKKNGFIEGVNLFTTSEEKGLDMTPVKEIAKKVEQALSI